MEAVIAVGRAPLAGTDVLGLSGRLRPWVSAALPGRGVPALLDWQDLAFESIAALEPDLILYVNSPGDEATYDLLSRIAPTVGPPAGTERPFGVPWREQLDVIGRVIGRSSEATLARTEVDRLLAVARSEHPEFAGRSVVAGVARGTQVFLLPPDDPRVELLAELGLETARQQTQDSGGGYLAPLSPDRYDLLEADVVVMCALDDDGDVSPSLLQGGTFERLTAAREQRVVYLPGPSTYTSQTADGDYASALAIGGPLGIPAVLGRLTSELAQVTSRWRPDATRPPPAVPRGRG